MRLELAAGRRLTAALVMILASCSSGASSTSELATTNAGSTRSAPATDTSPTVVPSIVVSTMPTTSTVEQPSSTTLTPATDTGATTVAPIPCQSTVDFLPTRSGRRVLLRANGLTGPSPTIVVVHGYTGTPTGIERFVELTERANTSGIAVAYPEGSPTPDGGFGWNSGAAVMATELVDDVTVLGEMIDAMVMSGCVDPARVILAGESNGAALALVAACEPQLATRFMRVVLAMPPSIAACCNAARTVPKRCL